MNSSNEKKINLGQAALRGAAYIVLLNAALLGFAGDLDNRQTIVVAESEIYAEVTVIEPAVNLRRVRIRKRMRQATGVSQTTASDFTGMPLTLSQTRSGMLVG